MPEQAEKAAMSLEQLQERLGELETRVAALENARQSHAGPAVESLLGVRPKEEKRGAAIGTVPVLGKAVLAMAGAYLLRAVAESGAAPRWLLLALGIGYAGACLVWAARMHRRSSFASTTFGVTSALILAPLLWEGTVRFHELAVGATAAVLVGYVVLALIAGWKEKLEAIPWVAVVSAVGTALVLLVATHELNWLTVALLAIAFLTEAATWSGRWPGLAAVPALGADFAVGTLGMLMTVDGALPAGYRAISAVGMCAFGASLALLYGGGLAARGFGAGKKWSLGEVAQAAAAVALGTWVSLRATQGGAARVIGLIFLLLAIACYWGAWKRFAGAEARWNRRISMNFAAALALAGAMMSFHTNERGLLLSVAAIAAVLMLRRTGYLTWGIHAVIYLLAASSMCGLFTYAAAALAGNVPGWPAWSLWTVVLAALVSYLAGSDASEGKWQARLLWVVPVVIAGLAVTALTVAGIAGLGAGELSASRLSVVRTVVTCIVALGLGFAESWGQRRELGWVAYGAVALGALKLVLEDLRFGNAGTLMVSLLFYGLVLILLPRVARLRKAET